MRAPAEFDRVFSAAERARIDWFLVMARPNECGHARLGLIVAKKQLRRAVDRNRVKRCAREAFRSIRAELPACDFVVRLIARPEPGQEGAGLSEALKRAGRRALAKWPASPAPPLTE